MIPPAKPARPIAHPYEDTHRASPAVPSPCVLLRGAVTEIRRRGGTASAVPPLRFARSSRSATGSDVPTATPPQRFRRTRRWSATAMTARYQHMVDVVRTDIAKQIDGLIWRLDTGRREIPQRDLRSKRIALWRASRASPSAPWVADHSGSMLTSGSSKRSRRCRSLRKV
ncbi:hypothetical protein B0675_05090 [Streptomyces sp. M41(2017)]|nr:hypothetical protein B0675_05090 [Streptomyces sp. M41(2017)]